MLRPWILQVRIDKSSSKALYLQIADSIISIIANGVLKKNDALPSSRILAQQLHISRKTVVSALDLLVIEGWLYSRDRIGLFVSNELPTNINNRPTILDTDKEINTQPIVTVFDDGIPDTGIAPMNELARAYRQIFSRKAKWQMMGYSDELGSYKFREAISSMLNHNRGMRTHPSQLCITRGSQMALYLIAHVLLQKDDIVLVENPGFKQAWDTFRHAGATLMPVAVDDDGVSVDQIQEILSEHKIKAIYLTPHHQYPTTISLTLERRLKLSELAEKYDFTIIEDDYDNEFHFGQRPILPLSTLIQSQHSVYIGSLSKMISPALRIGYLVTEASMIERIGALRKIIDVQGDNIMEQAVLELINSGDIRKHIRRASKYYKAKRDFFATLIDKHLADKVTYKKPEGGLAFWLVFRRKQNFQKLNELLIRKGIQIITPDKYSFDTPANGIRLGYASLSEAQLEEAVILLSKFIE